MQFQRPPCRCPARLLLPGPALCRTLQVQPRPKGLVHGNHLCHSLCEPGISGLTGLCVHMRMGSTGVAWALPRCNVSHCRSCRRACLLRGHDRAACATPSFRADTFYPANPWYYNATAWPTQLVNVEHFDGKQPCCAQPPHSRYRQRQGAAAAWLLHRDSGPAAIDVHASAVHAAAATGWALLHQLGPYQLHPACRGTPVCAVWL